MQYQAPRPYTLAERATKEINRLMQVAEQWSVKEPHRIQDNATYYNTVGRNRLSHHYCTPNISPVPWKTDKIGTSIVRDIMGIITIIGDPNTTTGQRKTTGGIPKLYHIHIMILPL